MVVTHYSLLRSTPFSFRGIGTSAGTFARIPLVAVPSLAVLDLDSNGHVCCDLATPDDSAANPAPPVRFQG